MTDLIKYQPGLLGKLGTGGFTIDVFGYDILLTSDQIAGTGYQDVDTTVSVVSEEGDTLELKREPDNEHDEFAIVVWKGSIKCGYIPRRKSEVIARLMDAGKAVFARSLPYDWEEGMFWTFTLRSICGVRSDG